MNTDRTVSVATEVTRDEIVVVTVCGELGLVEADTLRSALEPLLAAGRARFVLDLSGVPYLDSAALRVLVELYRRVLPEHGGLWIAGATAAVRRTLEITRFTKLFGMMGTVPEALDQVRRRPWPSASAA